MRLGRNDANADDADAAETAGYGSVGTAPAQLGPLHQPALILWGCGGEISAPDPKAAAVLRGSAVSPRLRVKNRGDRGLNRDDRGENRGDKGLPNRTALGPSQRRPHARAVDPAVSASIRQIRVRVVPAPRVTSGLTRAAPQKRKSQATSAWLSLSTEDPEPTTTLRDTS